jgi:PAS domain S-box-containing protein
VRLRPAEPDAAPARSPVMQSIAASALAFVVTDLAWGVQYANAAFAEMLGLATTPIAPQALTQWLQLSEEHHRALSRQMVERRAITEFTTRLQSPSGRVRPVDVCAVAVPPAAAGQGDMHGCWAFTLREIQSPGTIN